MTHTTAIQQHSETTKHTAKLLQQVKTTQSTTLLKVKKTHTTTLLQHIETILNNAMTLRDNTPSNNTAK